MEQYTPQYNTDRSARDHTALLAALLAMLGSALVVVFLISPSDSSTGARVVFAPELVSEVKTPVAALTSSFSGVLVAPGEGALKQLTGAGAVEFPDVPDRVAAMLQTEVGLWIAQTGATGGELLLVRNGTGAAPGATRIALPASVQGAEVRALASGHGRLWIGTSKGLLSYDWGRFNPYTPPSRFPLSRNSPNMLDVTALYLDHAGTLWIGTHEGLVSYNGTEMFRHTRKDGLPGDSVTAITGDPSGTLVVGTENGLVTYNKGTWVTQADIDDMVMAVAAAEDQLFVGTVNGLYQRLEGRWTRIAEGSLPSPVTALAWGPDALYIGTKQGLYKLAAKAVPAAHAAAGHGTPANAPRAPQGPQAPAHGPAAPAAPAHGEHH